MTEGNTFRYCQQPSVFCLFQFEVLRCCVLGIILKTSLLAADKPETARYNEGGSYEWTPHCVPFLTGKEAAVSEIQNGTMESIQECRTYTVNEVARILGVSTNAVYRLIPENLFRSVRIGSAIRISKRSFDHWLESLDL